MQLTPYTILVIIALVLAVVSIVVPRWPLLPVAVVMMAVAMLIAGAR